MLHPHRTALLPPHAASLPLGRFLLTLASLTLIVTTTTRAADWPGYRGPGGQGISPTSNPPLTWNLESNLVWKIALPGPGGSSPILVGNHIYLTCYTGYAVPGVPGGNLEALRRHLLCLDRTNGKILWQRSVPALQPEQEKVRDHGYASSTPAADAQRIYAFFGKSGVHAFSHEGQPLWKADVGSGIHGWGSASSPLLVNDHVIINAAVECESLVALDRRTGTEKWRSPGIKESWNTPILVTLPNGTSELVLAMLGKVLGFDPATGKQLWSCTTGIPWYMVPSLVSHGDVVYCIGGRSGGALAVRAGGQGDVTNSRRLWTLSKGSNVSSPILHQGHLYWLHETLGIVYCAELASGRLVYEERLPKAGQFYASPILANGNLFAVTREGVGFVLAAQPTFALLARNELRDRSSFDASPATDGNRLLLRSDKFLYCLGSH